ncbi:unnamed protein product [Linum trigynum]|uniref:Uncharacterized protein n=1 Tax=Linum trigynum TaxID=586398 RepID=A0AAV2D7K8_9ROSI
MTTEAETTVANDANGEGDDDELVKAPTQPHISPPTNSIIGEAFAATSPPRSSRSKKHSIDSEPEKSHWNCGGGSFWCF